MTSIFHALAKLRELQTEIQGNEHCRNYLRFVAQDPQTETFDLVASRTKLQANIKVSAPETNVVRLVLVKYLELVWLFLETHSMTTEVVSMWLYENHTRLTKYVILAKYLEYLNLSSMGALPAPDDIPQWAVVLWRQLTVFRKQHLPVIAAEYKHFLHTTEDNFLALCPESEHELCLERVKKFKATE